MCQNSFFGTSPFLLPATYIFQVRTTLPKIKAYAAIFSLCNFASSKYAKHKYSITKNTLSL